MENEVEWKQDRLQTNRLHTYIDYKFSKVKGNFTVHLTKSKGLIQTANVH